MSRQHSRRNGNERRSTLRTCPCLDLLEARTALVGVTVNFLSNNQARGGFGGFGGLAGDATGGAGGNGTHGGEGGTAVGGASGNGGIGGFGVGGGLSHRDGTLVINPRKGAKSGSTQAKATDLINGNVAQGVLGGFGGATGKVVAGLGGSPNGPKGHVILKFAGSAGTLGSGIGGGVAILAPATIDNTSITGNHASTADNDVNGTFSS